MNTQVTIDDVDQLLPQTQCGLCDYPGCRPYATALVEQGERIDRCPPGGTATLIALGQLLPQDPTPYLTEMQRQAKSPAVAVIREDECIGCTKCLQVCPTDAIIGAGKLMHTIISDACTGCELCLAPCPVDCIDVVTLPPADPNKQKTRATAWRKRHQQRNARIANHKKIQQQTSPTSDSRHQTLTTRRAAIEAAVARVRLKKGGDRS